jgi:hypothetical protein
VVVVVVDQALVELEQVVTVNLFLIPLQVDFLFLYKPTQSQ